MEDDFLLRQIKLIGEGVTMLLKKQNSSVKFSDVEREDGAKISRMDLIIEYIESNRIQEAFLQVNILKYKLSFYGFEFVSKWFIQLLKEYQSNGTVTITEATIDTYQQRLKELL